MKPPSPTDDLANAPIAGRGTSSPQTVTLRWEHIAALSEALLDAFDFDRLNRLTSVEFDAKLDHLVSARDSTLTDVVRDLVEWAVSNEDLGLQGLLAAALRQQPRSAKLNALAEEWAGLVFKHSKKGIMSKLLDSVSSYGKLEAQRQRANQEAAARQRLKAELQTTRLQEASANQRIKDLEDQLRRADLNLRDRQQLADELEGARKQAEESKRLAAALNAEKLRAEAEVGTRQRIEKELEEVTASSLEFKKRAAEADARIAELQKERDELAKMVQKRLDAFNDPDCRRAIDRIMRMNIETLTGPEIDLLTDAITHAFKPFELKMLLVKKLDVQTPEAVLAEGNLTEQAFDLVRWAIQYGRLTDLLVAMLESNPNNPQIREFTFSFRVEMA